MLHGLKKMCNMHDNEMEQDGHRHNPIYDHAYMFDDAHPNADVIDGDDGDDDDDDDGDYDYAPAASMEGQGVSRIRRIGLHVIVASCEV
nr:hypothetical protein [Tanacetum cinerariifolium]